MPAFADMPGDDGAHELSADLPDDTAACDAGDLVEHFADDERRTNACRRGRTKRGYSSIRAPGGRAKRCSLLGDPHLANRVSDESGRAESRTTLTVTAARLLGDGLSAASPVTRPCFIT